MTNPEKVFSPQSEPRAQRKYFFITIRGLGELCAVVVFQLLQGHQIYQDQKVEMRVSRACVIIGVFLAVATCLSCSSSPLLVQKKKEYAGNGVCRAAILPFVNASRFDQGDVVFQRIFATQMSGATGIDIVAEGDVRKLYAELRIYPNTFPDIEQLRVLGSRLKADLLIGGRVVEMEEKMGGNFVNPVLSVDMQTYDGRSGEILWTTYHRREGKEFRKVMHFGLVNTITQLSRIMADEIVHVWTEEGVKQCEK